MQRKLNFIESRQTELTAEVTSLKKIERAHEAVESFVLKAMEGLKEVQKSQAAKILNWSTSLNLTREGGKISAPSLTERMYARLVEVLEKDEPAPVKNKASR